MTMVNKSHRVLTLFLAIFMMFSLVAPMSVFADLKGFAADNTTVQIDGGVLTTAQINKAIELANEKNGYKKSPNANLYLLVEVEGIEQGFVKSETDDIIIDKTVWKQANQKDLAEAFQCFIDALVELGYNPDAVQTVMNNISDKDDSLATVMLMVNLNDVKADLYRAYKIMEPFLNILNVVLGVGCVLLMLILVASTVMDLAYIGLPMWRETQDAKGKKNPFGVSYEALRTVQEVEKGLGGGDGDYRNAYLLYFKRRALTYIILAICIMYLICGGISGIIGFVLSLVTGITG